MGAHDRRSHNRTLQALILGAVAGMRTMTAPALISNHLSRQPRARPEEPLLKWLSLAPTANTLSLAALGEFIGDKLPVTPNRTIPPSLAARTASGAMVGWSLFAIDERPAWQGAALGALAAVASTFAIFHLRRQAGQRSAVPDHILGALEDLVALAGGSAALNRL